MAEDTRAIAERIVGELFNDAKLEVADELYADEFRFHSPFFPEPLQGPEGMKQVVSGFHTAFPDLNIELDDLIVEGDMAAVRYTASGTNDGQMMGLPPTNRTATWSVVHMLSFDGGKVVEDRAHTDRMGLMEQLGHLPASGQA